MAGDGSTSKAGDARIYWAALAIVLLLLAAYFLSKNQGEIDEIKERQRARQVVPGYANRLQRNKSGAESFVAELKGFRWRPASLAPGKNLYRTAKDDQDACISYLVATIYQYTQTNSDEAENLLRQAEASDGAFEAWARERLAPPGTWGYTPGEAAGRLPGGEDILNLTKWINDEDKEQARHLERWLKACRFREWSAIPADRTRAGGR